MTLRRWIEAKRDGEVLDARTWRRIVAQYARGEADDAEMAALAMAATLRGLDLDETVAITEAMAASGITLDWHGTLVADKHSTGGVGDTVTMIAVPLVAACGLPVAKLSGRALGHTGGTLDKLEAIPGYRSEVLPARFMSIVREVGCSIAAQSADFVPADKRLYALRDRTGSIPSIGLIAASIVSKKIAGGASVLVFDVKCGRGAFMRATDDARELAARLVAVACRFGRRARAVVTDMDEPLGPAIGTGLEAIEARDFLRGARRDLRLATVVRAISRAMLECAGRDATPLERVLDDGSAYERFVATIEAHGSSRSALEALATPAAVRTIQAPASGFVQAIDAAALGEVARVVTTRDSLAGIRVVVRGGDAVEAGAPLAHLYGGDDDDRANVAAAFSLGESAPVPRPLVVTSLDAGSGDR